MYKRISAPAIAALKDALVHVYWYKKDLRGVLNLVVARQELLVRIDWDASKRDIVSGVIDYMASHQESYQTELLTLMSDISQVTDFSHLTRLEDGQRKVIVASGAVRALRALFEVHRQADVDRVRAEPHRASSLDRVNHIHNTSDTLQAMKLRYQELLKASQKQARGYELEKMMYGLFDLFDLDPKVSFKTRGEQVDGAFTFDSTDFIFEAKWQQDKTPETDLIIFSRKVERRLENTLGLFLSISGFSDSCVSLNSLNGPRILLMDGEDLYAVLDERLRLDELFLRKRRYASHTGEIYISVREMLA